MYNLNVSSSDSDYIAVFASDTSEILAELNCLLLALLLALSPPQTPAMSRWGTRATATASSTAATRPDSSASLS
jgi:hypothetical protein